MPKELPVSSMQKAALREASLSGRSQVSTQLSLSFGEILDRPRWQKAWQLVVKRHPILRSTFHHAARGSLALFENETMENPWAQPDWSSVDPKDLLEQWKVLLVRDAQESFSRESLPLWRVTLLQLPGGASHMLWTFHPALLDEESVSIILRDWLAIYEMLAKDEEPDIQPTPSYGSVASVIDLPSAEADAFWVGHLAELKRHNPFQTLLHAVAPEQAGREAETLDVAPDTATKLGTLAKELSIPRDAILTAAWGMLLCRCGGQGDLAIGIVRSARPLISAESDGITGLFSRRLPLHVHEKPDTKLRDWLKEIAETYQQMQPAIFVEGETILQAAGDSSAPLWQTDALWRPENLNSQLHTRMPRWLGLDAQLHESFSVPVALRANGDSRLEISLNFDSAQLSNREARDLLAHLSALLNTLAFKPEATSADLLQLNLPELPPKTSSVPDGALLSRLLNPKLAGFGDQPALQLGEDSISFQDLEIFSNQFARYLRRSHSGDAPIAVCMTTTPWIGVALLGVLKDAAPLVFANPEATPESLVERLTKLGVRACVTDSVTDAYFAETGIKTVPLDQVWDKVSQQVNTRPTVKYTEAPRLFLVPAAEQPNGIREYRLELLATELEQVADVYELRREDRVLSTQPPGTLPALEELLVAINHGATLIQTDDSAHATRTSFQEMLETNRITHLRLTSARWSDWVHVLQQLQKRVPADLKRVLIETGHHLETADRAWSEANDSQSSVVWFHSPFSLVGTGFVREETSFQTRADSGLPIGRAFMPDRLALVVDFANRPLPFGYSGDLVVSLDPSETKTFGDAVVQVMLNGSSAPFLKTNQMGYRDRDGNFSLLYSPDFTYTGRLSWNKTAQIEQALAEHPLIYDAIVDYADSEDGSPLSAWIVPRDSQTSLPDAIGDFLEAKIPAHLIPRKWASLNRYPISKSGHIDRSSLPTPTEIQRRKASIQLAESRSNAQSFSPDKKTAAPKSANGPLLAEIQIIRSTGNGAPVVLLFEDEPRKEMLEVLDSVLPPDLPIAILCLPAGKVTAQPRERLVGAATSAIKSFLPKGVCHVVSGGNMAVHAIQVAARIQRPAPHPKALVLVNPTLPPLYFVAGMELIHQLKSGLQKAVNFFTNKDDVMNTRKVSSEGGLRYDGVVHLITDNDEPKPIWKILLPNAVYHSMPGFSDSELASYISTIITKIENESLE